MGEWIDDDRFETQLTSLGRNVSRSDLGEEVVLYQSLNRLVIELGENRRNRAPRQHDVRIVSGKDQLGGLVQSHDLGQRQELQRERFGRYR